MHERGRERESIGAKQGLLKRGKWVAIETNAQKRVHVQILSLECRTKCNMNIAENPPEC
jgi:hypothetical protein